MKHCPSYSKSSQFLLVIANNSSSVLVPTRIPGVCFLSIPDFDPYNMDRPDSVHPNWTFLATVNGHAAPPTIVVNALVIWAVVGDESLRSSSFNVLLASLAVTDFLVGLLVEPLYCFFLGCLLNNWFLPDCIFSAYFVVFTVCGGATMITLTIASVERYLAIEHPKLYLHNITVKKVMTTTIIAWVIVLVCLLIPSIVLNQIQPDLFKVPGATAGAILVVTILYCTSKVQLTAYRQSRNIALQQESVLQPDEQQQQEQRLKDRKRVFTMTILVVLSILFYIPSTIVTVIQVVKGEDETSDFQYLTMPICTTFTHLQSLINPIIMSLRLSYIRQAIKNKVTSLVQAWN